MGGELAVNEYLQFFRSERLKRHFPAIEKDCRGSFHVQRMGALAVQKDAPFNYFTSDVLPELFQVKADFRCITFKDGARIKNFVPCLLAFINHIVHFPKLALQTGSLGRTCCNECVRMIGHEGKLTKDYS